MLNRGIKKYILNPCLGLSPYLLYLILYNRTEDVQNSLIISILVSAFFEIITRIYSKYSKTGVLFLMSFISLTISLIVWKIIGDLPHPQSNLYYILPEIITVTMLMLMQIYQKHAYRKPVKKESNLQKIFNHEIFELSALIQYTFTIHIFVVAIYKFLKGNNITLHPNDTIVYVWIPIIVSIILIFYESFRLKVIARELHMQEWLPIVNEKGDVIGKIAKSNTIQMKNKFLHPIVRVALVCKDKIYLQKRANDDILDPGNLDHPFEKYMLFEHEINLSARNSIRNALGKELPFKFLLKYTFDNENTKRLIFLFVSIIKDEEELVKHSSLNGKFWSTQQIDEGFNDSSQFGECFQLEYEYLKNTVLTTNQSENKTTNTKTNQSIASSL